MYNQEFDTKRSKLEEIEELPKPIIAENKFPREDALENLIKEFFALRLAKMLTGLLKYSVSIPDVAIVKENNKFCLKIEMYGDKIVITPNDKDIQALLQCVVIDCIVGNNAHKIKKDIEGNVWHINFKQSFLLNKESIAIDIEKIASNNSSLVKNLLAKNTTLLQNMLNLVTAVPDIEKSLSDCLVKAAEELRQVLGNENSEKITQALDVAKAYVSGQSTKISQIKNDFQLSIQPPPPKRGSHKPLPWAAYFKNYNNSNTENKNMDDNKEQNLSGCKRKKLEGDSKGDDDNHDYGISPS